jgi:hypothetical protein
METNELVIIQGGQQYKAFPFSNASLVERAKKLVNDKHCSLFSPHWQRQ